MRGDPEHPRSLADKLTYLFDHVRRPDGRKYTLEQVAQAVARTTGRSCTRQYLSNLCSGSKDNPTMDVLEALAGHFDVSPAYFFDDKKSAEIVDQINLALALRDGGVREIALRALLELDPKDVPVVTDVIKAIGARRQEESGGG